MPTIRHHNDETDSPHVSRQRRHRRRLREIRQNREIRHENQRITDGLVYLFEQVQVLKRQNQILVKQLAIHATATNAHATAINAQAGVIHNIAQNQEGAKLVYGNIGKIVSWLWLVSGLALMIYGFFVLWRKKSLERLIAIVVLIVIIVNWLIALMTIGDHRFRIPILGMSIFLQAVGIQKLFKKKLV